MWTQFEFVSLWRRGIVLLILLSLKQSVNQLQLNGTIDLTISQLVFSLAAMFKRNRTWCMKRILLQYIVCAGNLCNVFLLDLATIKTCVYACNVYHWHFLELSIFEPYLCTGFDCGSWVWVSWHCQKPGVWSSVRWLHVCSSLLQVIVAITFL